MLMLGLLATIVGFIVTGVNIAANYEPLASAAIIGMLAGLILIVFAGFATIVSWDSPPWPRIAVAVFGVILVVACAYILMARPQETPTTLSAPTLVRPIASDGRHEVSALCFASWPEASESIDSLKQTIDVPGGVVEVGIGPDPIVLGVSPYVHAQPS